MKNMRMSLLSFSFLIIAAQTPMVINAMQNSEAAFSKDSIACFNNIHNEYGNIFCAENNEERKKAEEKMLALLPIPKVSTFLGFMGGLKKIQELAFLFTKNNYIESLLGIVGYDVSPEVIVRFMEYIRMGMPENFENVFIQALHAAAACNRLPVIQELLTYGRGFNVNYDNQILYETLLVMNNDTAFGCDPLFTKIMLQIIPGEKFIDHVHRFLQDGRDDLVHDLMQDFIVMRFEKDAACVAQIFQQIYEPLKEHNIAFSQLLLQMLSEKQFIQVIQECITCENFDCVFRLIADITSNKTSKELANIMVLFNEIPLYKSDSDFCRYVKLIFTAGLTGKSPTELEEDSKAIINKYKTEQMEIKANALKALNRAMEEENARNQQRINACFSCLVPGEQFVENKPRSAQDVIERMYTVLCSHIENNQIMKVLKYLREYASQKPDVVKKVFQYQRQDGFTLLHLLAMKLYTKPVEMCWNILLSLGIDIAIQDYAGNTLLHTAIMFGNNKLAAQLIAFGANTSVKNQCGQMPYDLMPK